MNLPQPPVLVWHVLNAACVGAIAFAGGASRSAAWGAFAFALGCIVAWWIAGVRNGVAAERRRLDETLRVLEDGAEFDHDFDRVFTSADQASAWLEDLDQVERAALFEAFARILGADPRAARIAVMTAESCPSAAAYLILRGIRGHAVVCTRPPHWRVGDDERPRPLCEQPLRVVTCVRGPRERPWCCLAAWPDVAFGPCPPLTSSGPCGVPGDRAARQTPLSEIVTPTKSCT